VKAQDGKKIEEEIKLIDGLMHNVVREGTTMADVNRLLSGDVLSYVLQAD